MDALRHIEMRFQSHDLPGGRKRLVLCPTDHDQSNAQLMDVSMAKLERVRLCRLKSLTIDLNYASCHNGCCRMVHYALLRMADWCTALLQLAPIIHVPRDPLQNAVYQDEPQNTVRCSEALFVTATGWQIDLEELLVHSHGLKCRECYFSEEDGTEWHCSRWMQRASYPFMTPQYLPPAGIVPHD